MIDEERSHRTYNQVEENAILSPPRPLLVLNHYPKAGGGSLRDILRKVKGRGMIVKQEELRKEDENTDKALANFLDEARGHAENAFVIVKELDGTTLELHRAKGFVIGSMREPCAHYVSLWAFGSAGKGGFRHRHENLATLYGQDAPAFNTSADILRFQQWIQHSQVVGTIARQARQSYNGPSLSGVDCFVFVEAFQQSLVECLQLYAQQGGYVNWTKPEVVDLVVAAKSKEEDSRHRRDQLVIKDDPLGDPRLNHHASCSQYFDDSPGLYAKMESGPEAFLFSHFGYQGCCNPGDSYVAPPAVPVHGAHNDTGTMITSHDAPGDSYVAPPAVPVHGPHNDAGIMITASVFDFLFGMLVCWFFTWYCRFCRYHDRHRYSPTATDENDSIMSPTEQPSEIIALATATSRMDSNDDGDQTIN